MQMVSTMQVSELPSQSLSTYFTTMGTLRITSLNPKFIGSHFCLPLSFIQRKTGWVAISRILWRTRMAPNSSQWLCSWWDCLQPPHIGRCLSLSEQIDHLCSDAASPNTLPMANIPGSNSIHTWTSRCIGRESRWNKLPTRNRSVVVTYNPTVAYIRQKPLTTTQCTFKHSTRVIPSELPAHLSATRPARHCLTSVQRETSPCELTWVACPSRQALRVFSLAHS